MAGDNEMSSCRYRADDVLLPFCTVRVAFSFQFTVHNLFLELLVHYLVLLTPPSIILHDSDDDDFALY